MQRHIIQSDLWAKFKQDYGTPAVFAGNVWYTKHKVPLTSYFYAYAARVNPFEIDFKELEESLRDNNCIALHIDVPNVTEDSEEADKARDFLSEHCEISSRDEFARGNFLMDISPSEEKLLENMHKKHRYNIKYAQKSGVVVRRYESEEDFDKFYNIYKETTVRQSYYGRSRNYIKKIWDTFREHNMCEILIAEYQGEPLASWFLFIDKDVLYYPYGGSLDKYKNLQASSLIGWEAIRYGKSRGCTLFDMWGAIDSMDKEDDPYYGFSLFKQRFGAKHVRYVNSYDLIVNPPLYKMFTTANSVRWKFLKFLK